MLRTQDTDDPTCVRNMLDEFRSSTNLPNFTSIESTMMVPKEVNDTVTLTDNKKRKFSDSNVSVNTAEVSVEDPDVSMFSSQWEIRCLKAELAERNAQIANLEEQIKKLHHVRMELELMFDNEKRSLLKEQERDREKIQLLEARIAALHKREVEGRNELTEYRQSSGSVRYKLENKIIQLQEENAKLDDQLKQVEQTHKKCATGEARISELEAQLVLSVEETASLKDYIKSLERKVNEVTNLKHQIELTEHRYTQAQQRIKLLELEQDEGKELREQLEKQQHRLLQFANLEREVAVLRNENRNLKDAVHNKLVLEEEVMDLRSRQSRFEKLEQRSAQLEASHRHLESKLKQWQQLARDHCPGFSPDKAMAGPELLRMRIETLQQKELLLTADKGRLDSRLKAVEQEKRKIDVQLDEARKQIERMQVVTEERSIAIKRLQKRLLLVSRERDSYRSQLDAYEKDLTITSPGVLNLPQQQQRSRIEALEKTLEGYRELVERWEGEREKTMKGSGGIDYNERIRKLEEERNSLLHEKEQLTKRVDELGVELEHRALKGDYNRVDTKVLHFRMNPAAKAAAQHENKLKCLEQECDRLRERVRLLEEGQTQDLTQAVNLHVASSKAQEVQELQGQVKSYEIKLQRLKEAFKTTSQEFRDACYMLLGYKIDCIKPKFYRLSSMYAESPHDYLMFQLSDNGPNLLETPYSETLESFINLHLRQHHSFPVFMSAITVDLFSHQTMDSTNEHITVD